MVPCRSLLVVALSATLAGCHSFYQVHGTVLRCEDQRPVAGAVVALRYAGEFGAIQTDASGAFRVAVNDPPGDQEAELVVAAPGYRVEARTVRHSRETPQQVCLAAAAPATGP